MNTYSFDEWDKMSAAEKDDLIRAAWMRKVSIQEYTRKPVPNRSLGTDFDRKFLKDCGIATEGI